MADPRAPTPQVAPTDSPPSGLSPDTQDTLITTGLIGKVVGDLTKSIPIAKGFFSEFGTAVKNSSDLLLQFSGVTESTTQRIDKLIRILNVDQFGQAIGELGKELKSGISTYQELDKQFIQLGKGQNSQAFLEYIRLQAQESGQLGISLKTLLDVNKELIKNYTAATYILPRQTAQFQDNIKAITELVGFNEKFNISQQDTIKILNLFNNTMEGGSKGAQKLSDNLLIFAERTGQQVSRVFQEFNSNIDRFATLTSDRAVESFQKLELMAARTGQSVSGVIGAIRKFDDIDSGFQAGGQLNRVLSFMGGSFDTFRAIQASDEERASMLYQAIAQTGDRFQQLQTEQARRAMVKQIEEASGLDTKTIMGLLNKSTNLAEDLRELSYRPAITEEFTETGRRDAGLRATTIKELDTIQVQLTELNPIVRSLSDNMKANTARFNYSLTESYKGIESALIGALTAAGGNQAGIQDAYKKFYEAIKVVAAPGADIIEQKLKEAGDKGIGKTDPYVGVLASNTNVMQSVVKAVNDFKTQTPQVNVNLPTQPVNVMITFDPAAKAWLKAAIDQQSSPAPPPTVETALLPSVGAAAKSAGPNPPPLPVGTP